VRVYKTKHFERFARRERIADLRLCEAAERAARGLVDADLGGGLITQRIARQGQGRSSGYRTLFAHQVNKRAVFVYGFAKNERDNIDVGELEYWRGVARALLAMTEAQLKILIEQRELMEVNCNDET
jgi:hypothetical protein